MTTGFQPTGGREWIAKDPDAKLPYGRDWSDWLADGDTIASATWSIAPQAVGGLTVNADKSGVVGPIAYVFLEGGAAGVTYAVTCRVVTASGLQDDRTFDVRCEER